MLQAARGKYIAYLEGDDYWTDNKKVQKQVSFLEQNPNYNICFHQVRLLEGNKLGKQLTPGNKDVFDFSEVLNRKVSIGSGSMVFKRKDYSNLPAFLSFDWSFILYHCYDGLIKFMPEEMGVYRKHEGGWTKRYTDQKARTVLDILFQCKTFFKDKNPANFDPSIALIYSDLLHIYFRDGNYNAFRELYDQTGSYLAMLPLKTQRSLKFRKSLSQLPLFASAFNQVKAITKKMKGIDPQTAG
jgi:hypothetical protein